MKLTHMELSSHIDMDSPIPSVVLSAVIHVEGVEEWRVDYRPDMTITGLARGLTLMAGMLMRFATEHDVE